MVDREEEDLDIDFDDGNYKYEVWAVDEGSEFERLVAYYDDADTAVSEAACLTLDDIVDIPCYVDQLLITVEVSVQLDADQWENEGHIYEKTLSVRKH